MDLFRSAPAATPAPAPGWHPAPDRAGWLRWWDGAGWTENYHRVDQGGEVSAVVDRGPVRPQQGTADERRGSTSERARSGGRRGPAGRPVDAWARATLWQNVVGEAHYRPAFAALLRASGRRPQEFGTELPDLTALLAAEPNNRHDPNAVAVWVGGHQVGYLPRDEAERYSPALQDLAEDGAVLEVAARVWVAGRGDDRGGSVTVTLPPPDGVQPFNALPEDPHTVLPQGSALQVTGEELHMDVLERYVSDSGRHLAVTLHLVDEAKTARSTPYRAVEVRLDAARVGVLTKASSDKVGDLVDYVAQRGRIPVARGHLKGSALRAELTLFVARSHEVPGRWLERIEHVGPGPA